MGFLSGASSKSSIDMSSCHKLPPDNWCPAGSVTHIDSAVCACCKNARCCSKDKLPECGTDTLLCTVPLKPSANSILYAKCDNKLMNCSRSTDVDNVCKKCDPPNNLWTNYLRVSYHCSSSSTSSTASTTVVGEV